MIHNLLHCMNILYPRNIDYNTRKARAGKLWVQLKLATWCRGRSRVLSEFGRSFLGCIGPSALVPVQPKKDQPNSDSTLLRP